MQDIPRASGIKVEWPAKIGKQQRYVFCATTDGNNRYVAKSVEWPAGYWGFPIRHGVEFIYYVLAAHNNLPMPKACILTIREEEKDAQHWATEYLEDRIALGQKESQVAADVDKKLKATLGKSQDEKRNLLLATFLDVMLLARDRTAVNVLKVETDEILRLFYFDHEQSCGWYNDTSTGGKIRVRSPETEFMDVSSCFANFARQLNIKEISVLKEREAIFRGIELTEELLMKVQQMLQPTGWVTTNQFSAIRDGLVPWWKFLRDQPYEKIDAAMFA